MTADLDARPRAVRGVANLILALRTQGGLGAKARLEQLGRELGLMQSTDPEGTRLARMWCLLMGW